MRSVLYGVGVYDAPTLATVVLTLVLVTLLATILPILKIRRLTQPIRYERNRTGLSTTTTDHRVSLAPTKGQSGRPDESWKYL